MEWYTSRLYIKFKEEKDWKQFIELVELESYFDHEKHPLSEFRDFFHKSIGPSSLGGVRISRNDLDCLLSDGCSERAMEPLIFGYSEFFRKNGIKAILLDDSYNYTRSPGNSHEYYFLGGEVHEYYRDEDDDEPANEHFKIDIADCKEWLGYERIYELDSEERALLYEIGGPRKKVITEEEKAVLKKLHKNDEKKTLKDIYPNLNKELDNGLIIKEGVCFDMDHYQAEYLGMKFAFLSDMETEDICLYIPPEVVDFDNNDGENDVFFGLLSSGFDTVVFTTNLRKLDPSLFNCRGFKHVYIIDAETEDVIFHSEKFYLDERYDKLYEDELWNEFCENYNKWPAVAMANPLYYDPEINSWYESRDWEEYVDRLINPQETVSVVND